MTEADFTPEEIEAIAEEAIPSETEDYDFNTPEMQEKIAKLKEALDLQASEPSGELTPEAIMAQKMASATPEKPITGADVDWSDYELDPQIAHLYPRAILKIDNELPQWISYIDEFHTASKNFDGHGLNKKGEPLGAGEYASMMVNGPEGWRLVAFLPAGVGMVGVVFQRRLPVNLPMPMMVRTTTEVAPLTDEELQNAERTGIEWAAQDDEDAALSRAEIEAEHARKAGENPLLSSLAGEALAALEGADYAEPDVASPGSEEK